MKKKHLQFIVIAITTIGLGCSHSSNVSKQTSPVNKNAVEEISKYIKKIFGEKKPSLRDYYYYEGRHSEKEYKYELQACMARGYGSHKVTIKRYAIDVPSACRDWLKERSSKPASTTSLYYESKRNKFSSLPFQYQIISVQEDNDGYKAKVLAIKERKIIVLNRFRSITDPETTVIVIKSISEM